MTRRESALHASCAGGVTAPEDFGSKRDDMDQLIDVNAITLHYHPRTRRVLWGPEQGKHIEDAVHEGVEHLLEYFGQVVIETVTLRPWWRAWRRTPAKRLFPRSVRSLERRARGGQTCG